MGVVMVVVRVRGAVGFVARFEFGGLAGAVAVAVCEGWWSRLCDFVFGADPGSVGPF